MWAWKTDGAIAQSSEDFRSPTPISNTALHITISAMDMSITLAEAKLSAASV